MKLDQLREVKNLNIYFSIVKADSLLLPQQSIHEENITITVEKALTYGIFLFTGNASSTNGTSTEALTEQINMVIFAPRNNNGWNTLYAQYGSTRTEFTVNDTYNAYLEIFGNVGDLVAYTLSFGFERCSKITTIASIYTLYPHVTTADQTVGNSNIMVDGNILTADANENGYYFPIFVDVNLTRNFDNGNLMNDILIEKSGFEFHLLKDVNLITGQLSTWDNLNGGKAFYANRNTGNQFFSGFMNRIKAAVQMTSYLPYLYPNIDYKVVVDYGTGLIDINYNLTNFNPLSNQFTFSLYIETANGSRSLKNIGTITQSSGHFWIKIEDLLIGSYVKVNPIIYFNNEYIGKILFVVAESYDLSVNLASSLNVLIDKDSIPSSNLTIEYKKKQ